MVNCALVIYLAICIRKLITGDENIRISFLASSDLKEQGDVSYLNDTSIKIFAVIRNDGIAGQVPYLNNTSNFSQYLDVYWTQSTANYYIPSKAGLNRYTHRNIRAKNCE